MGQKASSRKFPRDSELKNKERALAAVRRQRLIRLSNKSL